MLFRSKLPEDLKAYLGQILRELERRVDRLDGEGDRKEDKPDVDKHRTPPGRKRTPGPPADLLVSAPYLQISK